MVSAKDPRDHASMSQDHQRLFARRRCGNRPPGRWKREGKAKPAIPESAGQPNFDPNPNRENLSTKGKAKATSKPAIAVITGFGVGLSGQEPGNTKRVGSASTCEPYREIIELGLSRHRNAMAIWQDLVSDHGFTATLQCAPTGQTHGSSRSSILCSQCLFRIRRSESLWNSRAQAVAARAHNRLRATRKSGAAIQFLWLSRFNSR